MSSARRNRRLITHIARLMVAVMLFVQGASLALACERVLAALPHAVTEHSGHQHEGDDQGSCITRCATAHQTVNKLEATFTKLPEAVLFRVVSVNFAKPPQFLVPAYIDLRVESPPDSRLRVLRI